MAASQLEPEGHYPASPVSPLTCIHMPVQISEKGPTAFLGLHEPPQNRKSNLSSVYYVPVLVWAFLYACSHFISISHIIDGIIPVLHLREKVKA